MSEDVEVESVGDFVRRRVRTLIAQRPGLGLRLSIAGLRPDVESICAIVASETAEDVMARTLETVKGFIDAMATPEASDAERAEAAETIKAWIDDVRLGVTSDDDNETEATRR